MNRTVATLVCLALATGEGVVGVLGKSTSDRNAPPTSNFQIGVVQVEVVAVATNKQGVFDPTLRTNDFQLTEDGVPQELSGVRLVNIPLPTGVTAAEAIAATTQGSEGRVFLLVMDDLQTNQSYAANTRLAARNFISKYMAPNDVVATTFTSGIKSGVAEFSLDHAPALRAIDSFAGLKEEVAVKREDPAADYKLAQAMQNGLVTCAPDQGLCTSQNSSAQGVPGAQGMGGMGGGASGGKSDPARVRAQFDLQKRLLDPEGSSLDARAAAAAMQSVTVLSRLAEAMGHVALPRRSIIYFSQGLDYDIDDVGEDSAKFASGVRDSLRQAIATATRNNVAFYAVDPRGGIVGEIGRQHNGPLSRSIESLRTLANETGGFAAVGTNDFAQAFERVVRENSQYYVLDYYPTKTKADGRFHKIAVTVLNRPDLNVVAHKGYWARDAKREEREQRERDKAQRKLQAQQTREAARATPATSASGAAAMAAPSVTPPAAPAAPATSLPTPDLTSTPPPASDPAVPTPIPPPAPAAAPAVAPAPTPAPGPGSGAPPSPAPAPVAAEADASGPAFPAQLMSQLVEMLSSSTTARGLPLRLVGVSFSETEHNKIAVFVEIRTEGGIPLQEQRNRFTTHIGTAGATFNGQGTVVASTQGVLNLNLLPEEAEEIRTGGCRWTLRFEVAPGAYQIRVVALEPLEGHRGSLVFDVDVPEYKGDAVLSCFLMRSSAAARRDIEGWRLHTAATRMSTMRLFSQDDVLIAAAEVYERKPRATQVLTKVLTEDGNEVLALEQSFGLDEFQDGHYVSYRTVPLAHIPPGRYILHYEARIQEPPKPSKHAVAPLPPLTREFPFTIQKGQMDARP